PWMKRIPMPAREEEGDGLMTQSGNSLGLADDGLQDPQDAAHVVEVIARAVQQRRWLGQPEELPGLAGRHAAEDRGPRPTGPLVEPPRGHHLGDALTEAAFDVVLLR